MVDMLRCLYIRPLYKKKGGGGNNKYPSFLKQYKVLKIKLTSRDFEPKL